MSFEVATSDWIAVDWGTTNVRAWLVSSDGEIKACRRSDDGMSTIVPGGFEAALARLISDFLSDRTCLPVVTCGMVGSRQGWVEAKYRQIGQGPLSAEEIVEASVVDQRFKVFVVPGLSQLAPPDVMRGEETQINGLLAEHPTYTGTICLPGTHTKWVSVDNGGINHFQTIITGELFALLCAQSILRFNVNSDALDTDVFYSAVCDALEDGQLLAKNLFRLRARALLEDVPDAITRSRLSGMMIGTELSAVRDFWSKGSVTIIGNDALTSLYQSALASQSIQSTITDADQMVVNGLYFAYRLIEEHHQCHAT